MITNVEIWISYYGEGEETEAKKIKNLKELRDLDWKKVCQVDVFVSDGNKTTFVIRLTDNNIKIVYPKVIKNVFIGDEFLKFLKEKIEHEIRGNAEDFEKKNE